MTTTIKWATPEAVQTAISTGLNALADGDGALSGEIDNLTDLYEFIALELSLASIVTGVTPYVAVWVLASEDATNYEDGAAGHPAVSPNRHPDAVFPLKGSVTTTYRRCAVNIPIPPVKLKLLLRNNAGDGWPGSGSTLKYSRYNLQVA